jgi:sugar lactone lactonase YvrE
VRREMWGARVALVAVVVFSACVLVNRGPAVRAAAALQVIAVVGGQPDDITTDPRGHLVWGDLARGTIDQLVSHRVVILARNLSIPEGIVVLPDGTIIVAEQGRDRIVRIGAHGSLKRIHTLRTVRGREGVDGIGRDPRTGNLLIPDPPHGTVLGMTSQGGHVRVIARGLGRPVDAAVDKQSEVLVPDENLGTLAVVSRRGKISYRGRLSIPDDVAVAGNGSIWVTTLGDYGLWVINPGSAPRRVLVGLANPQGLTLDRCGDPIVVEQNTARIVRLLVARNARHCAL